MNHFFRLLWLFLTARRRDPCPMAGPCLSSFVVLPFDLDVFWHMNNGVYFSIMDLGRVDLILRSGLFKTLRRAGYSAIVSAETLRFRRSLRLFQRYLLETRIIGWDDKAFLIEHRFLRKSKKTGSFDVVAEGIVRVRFLSRKTALASSEFVKLIGQAEAVSPPLPDWAALWNDAQSQLRELERAEGIAS
jgi:acyl-CoA thioesterase FadM